MTGSKVTAGMRIPYVYLLTLSDEDEDGWQIIGIFLEPASAKLAKEKLIEQGINEEYLAIDYAPIGVIKLDGIDEPYHEVLLN
jgi:hypothetical protein